MNRFWDRVLRPILDAVNPRVLVEVGVAQGTLTAKVLEWAVGRDAILHAMDPAPDIDVPAWKAQNRGRLVFHRARSLNVLGRLDGVEVALIDGDHNWYTVINELRLLERTAAKTEATPPLVALHDVDWPYGRRDLYYNPASIPAGHRQPYERKGMLPGQAALSEGGLNDAFNNAVSEQASASGVRGAIEDFLSESDRAWTFVDIPGLHGLGIIVPDGRLRSNRALASQIKSFRSARFLREWCREIELARIKTEIAVAQRGHTIEHLQTQLERGRELREGLEADITRLEAVLAEAVSTESQLRHELSATRDRLDELHCARGMSRG